MRKNIIFLLLIFSIFFIPQDPLYKISGYFLDFYSGEELNANISAIIVETGEKNTTFSQTDFEIILNSDLNYLERKFRITVFVNDSNKTGFSQIELGYGDKASQLQNCVLREYYFKGFALDEEGKPIDGKISVFVEKYRNSTEFSNGEWEIRISSCLIPGQIYNFKFMLESGEKRGFFTINQVGKP